MNGSTVTFVMFVGDTDMHRLLSAHNWRGGALAHPVMWPAGLRGMVRLMLDSKVPTAIVWGDERALLYNDPFIQFLGERHPGAIGRPLEEVWADDWAEIAPLVERAYAGEALQRDNQLMVVMRDGGEGQSSFTCYYSPLRDDDNRLSGMCCQVVETGARSSRLNAA